MNITPEKIIKKFEDSGWQHLTERDQIIICDVIVIINKKLKKKKGISILKKTLSVDGYGG